MLRLDRNDQAKLHVLTKETSIRNKKAAFVNKKIVENKSALNFEDGVCFRKASKVRQLFWRYCSRMFREIFHYTEVYDGINLQT